MAIIESKIYPDYYRLIIQQTSADEYLEQKYLPNVSGYPLAQNKVIVVDQVRFSLDPEVVVSWGNDDAYVSVGWYGRNGDDADPITTITTWQFTSSVVAAGDTYVPRGIVDCVHTWVPEGGYPILTTNTGLVLNTGGTGQLNILTFEARYRIVDATDREIRELFGSCDCG